MNKITAQQIREGVACFLAALFLGLFGYQTYQCYKKDEDLKRWEREYKQMEIEKKEALVDSAINSNINMQLNTAYNEASVRLERFESAQNEQRLRSLRDKQKMKQRAAQEDEARKQKALRKQKKVIPPPVRITPAQEAAQAWVRHALTQATPPLERKKSV